MLWLGLFARTLTGSTPVGLESALATGLYPFILPDLIKLAIAAGFVPALWRLLGRPTPADRLAMRTALTIAGSDSGAGAGIQADLKTFAAHGVYGTSAITAVTAQNTLGVTMFEAVSADLVTAQIEAVVADIGAHAAKTGMLANAAIVEAVAAAVKDLDMPFLVVDPVMIAKSGDRLMDDEAVGSLKTELLRQAFLVTPNIPEAEALSGVAHSARRGSTRGGAAHRLAGRHGGGDQGRPLPVRRHRRPAARARRVRRVPSRAGAGPPHARHRVHVFGRNHVSSGVGSRRCATRFRARSDTLRTRFDRRRIWARDTGR